MERHFEKDLNELKERLLWMGSLAERAVHQSVHAVLETDEQLAKRVLEEEDAINELQMEVDDRVVQLLALHQLMATDLRFVLAVSRINNDLERIGDQAVNIAQGALRVLRHPRVKPYVDLPRMSELVEEMVRNALNAVVRRDVELAQSVLATDDRVDHYRDQIFRELLTYMMGDSSVVFPAFELILVAKNLERIGDQHRRRRHLPRPGPGHPPQHRRPPLAPSIADAPTNHRAAVGCDGNSAVSGLQTVYSMTPNEYSFPEVIEPPCTVWPLAPPPVPPTDPDPGGRKPYSPFFNPVSAILKVRVAIF